jgi:CRISPR system Cascade subunit CasD
VATLLLQLVGPMQSWGTRSRFDLRDTGKEPSKSGVIGLVAAALGIDRSDWLNIEPLARCRMGVRHDRPGVPKCDYQTARAVISADRSKIHDTAVTFREYLADAAFLVGLECDDRALLERAHAALASPVWPLALGRKSYVPSEPIHIKNGLVGGSLRESLSRWPWISSLRRCERQVPAVLLASFESAGGSGVLKMDQPLSSYAERKFGARSVISEWMAFPVEAKHVSA